MLCKKVRQQINRRAPEEGQALTEFVLGLLIVISFFFFYVKMAAVFAIGNYIHYATFMSARAYYASAASPEVQKENGEAVLKKMLSGRWTSIVKPAADGNSSVKGGNVGPGPFKQEDAVQDAWNDGVTFSYSSSLSLYPWNKEGQSVNMKLTSESWLGREESVEECNQVRGTIQSLISSSGIPNIKVEWDNGC